MIIALLLLTVFLLIIYIVAIHGRLKDEQGKVSRLKRKVKRLENPESKWNDEHNDYWCYLWELICIRFGFSYKPDGSFNSSQAKEIYNLMGSEWGTFDMRQMRTLELILIHLSETIEKNRLLGIKPSRN